MGKLGFDIVTSHLSETDRNFAQQAVRNYHGFKDIIWHGDQYRLVNPHENDFSAVMYVNNDRTRSIMFNYLVNTRYKITATDRPVQLNGLDPQKKYSVKEINIYSTQTSTITSGKVYTGDYLMKVGINPDITLQRTSVVLEIDEVK
jgi:alpha-galactosidase